MPQLIQATYAPIVFSFFIVYLLGFALTRLHPATYARDLQGRKLFLLTRTERHDSVVDEATAQKGGTLLWIHL